ncbi:hypothetical protein CANDROIZ_810005 [Candidatus Roizmanbacteria bacterium]|nr:hypothetical protein CANDROIZ_810005 [Candidatus Roizmanbacteria bacterium]
MERVLITLFLPNYRNKLQPYLSELIWIKILPFWFGYPKSTERERYLPAGRQGTQLLQVFPQGYLRFRDGHFLSTIFLIPQFAPYLSFIKGVFRQREGTGYNCEPNDRER